MPCTQNGGARIVSSFLWRCGGSANSGPASLGVRGALGCAKAEGLVDGAGERIRSCATDSSMARRGRASRQRRFESNSAALAARLAGAVNAYGAVARRRRAARSGDAGSSTGVLAALARPALKGSGGTCGSSEWRGSRAGVRPEREGSSGGRQRRFDGRHGAVERAGRDVCHAG